jgi:hypothetical protein
LRLDHNLKNNDNKKKLSELSQVTSNRRSTASNDQSTDSINFDNKESILGLFEDKVEVKVADVPFTIAMSSITGLSDLIEDEIIHKPIPLEVIFFVCFLFFSFL